MNKNMKKVSADTTIAQLSQWLNEGRLYVASSSDELVDAAVDEIRRRVCLISGCCSETFKNGTTDLWRRICNEPSIRKRLVSKNGSKPNWYFVANILSDMLSRGVYDAKSLRALTELMRLSKSVAKNAMQESYRMSEAEYNDLKRILSNYERCLK